MCIETIKSIAVIFSQFGFGINTIVLAVGSFFALKSLENARISRVNAEFVALLSKNSDAIKRYEDNAYRMNALKIYFGRAGIKDETDHNELERLYWGARFMLIDMITIQYQAWIISGRKKRYEGVFSGFEITSQALSKELFQIDLNKPKYYVDACIDMEKYLTQGRWFSAEFVKQLRSKI